MTTNQTERVSDEELDQMIWKLERDGMTPKQLSLMRDLREVRRAKGEPVAWTSQRSLEVRDKITAFTCKESADNYGMKSAWEDVVPLYAAPPAPNFREISNSSTNEHVRREYRASDEQVVLREYRTNHSVWIQCSKQAYESRKAEGCEVRELYERPQAGNSPATPDGWISVSERMPDPKSELRVCVYTPNPHEDIRYRFVPASLFKAVCRDATHWHYMSAPKEVG